MSGGGGGHIIIRSGMRAVLQTGSVLEELGPRKRIKAVALLGKNVAEWSLKDFKFAQGCILDAVEAYEE